MTAWKGRFTLCGLWPPSVLIQCDRTRNTTTEPSAGTSKTEYNWSYLGGRSVGSLIRTWSWIPPPLTQRVRLRVKGGREGGVGQREWAAVGWVKEFVVNVSHQTTPCSSSLSRARSLSLFWALRVWERRQGEGSASVYLAHLLFSLWTQPV